MNTFQNLAPNRQEEYFKKGQQNELIQQAQSQGCDIYEYRQRINYMLQSTCQIKPIQIDNPSIKQIQILINSYKMYISIPHSIQSLALQIDKLHECNLRISQYKRKSDQYLLEKQQMLERISKEHKNVELQREVIALKKENLQRAYKEQIQKLLLEKEDLQKQVRKIQARQKAIQAQFRRKDSHIKHLQQTIKKFHQKNTPKVHTFKVYQIPNPHSETTPNPSTHHEPLLPPTPQYHSSVHTSNGYTQYNNLMIEKIQQALKVLTKENVEVKGLLFGVFRELNGFFRGFEGMWRGCQGVVRRIEEWSGLDGECKEEIKQFQPVQQSKNNSSSTTTILHPQTSTWTPTPTPILTPIPTPIFITNPDTNTKTANTITQNLQTMTSILSRFMKILEKVDVGLFSGGQRERVGLAGSRALIHGIRGKLKGDAGIRGLIGNYRLIVESQDQLLNKLISSCNNMRQQQLYNFSQLSTPSQSPTSIHSTYTTDPQFHNLPTKTKPSTRAPPPFSEVTPPTNPSNPTIPTTTLQQRCKQALLHDNFDNLKLIIEQQRQELQRRNQVLVRTKNRLRGSFGVGLVKKEEGSGSGNGEEGREKGDGVCGAGFLVKRQYGCGDGMD